LHGTSIKSLIWFCAEDTARGLGDVLESAGIKIIGCVVYRTQAIASAKIASLLAVQDDVKALSFAAPSAVRAFAPFYNSSAASIAIGETTADEMKRHGWQYITVSSSPTDKDCLSAVLEALNRIFPNRV